MAFKIVPFFEQVRNPARLSIKLGFNLALIGLAGFLMIFAFTAWIVDDRFGALEQREISESVSRTQNMLLSLQNNIRSKSLDWAVWDDSYEFIQDGNNEFSTLNLNFESLKNLDMNGISFVRLDGTRSQTVYYDLAAQTENAMLAKNMAEFAHSSIIRKKARVEPDFQAFARFGDKILVLSVSQVRRSDNTGRVDGYMIMGREIENALMSQLLQVDAEYDFNTSAAASDVRLSDRNARIGVTVYDVENRAVGTIRFYLTRDIMAEGTNLLVAVSAGIATLLLLLLLALHWNLQSGVVRPLESVERHVRRIGSTGELLLLEHDGRNDEIGSLKSGFNIMTEHLSALRAQLEKQSFELGKSQSSIGVMHNVRNGLSPVAAIVSILEQHLHLVAAADVNRSLNELHLAQTDPERQKKLVAFLRIALDRHEQQLAMCRNKIQEAGRNLAGVVEAIDQVQNVGDAKPQLMECDLSGLISANLSSVLYDDNDAVRVHIESDLSANVIANRVLLSQVIGNLLVNAKEAIVATGRPDGLIAISQRVNPQQDFDRVTLLITDNGDGFDRDVETKLFQRGFSTRTHKRGGLGLHWCANTMNMMHGSLSLTSEGGGRGAVATLVLPLAKRQSEDRAEQAQAA